jgi:ring-1,2-phenylacetyl-CoA epoxidase subunit PaaC
MAATAPFTSSIRLVPTPQVQHVLRWADTALIHAQRLSEWCGHGPVLEEDIAFTNLALDLMGQTRALLGHAAQLDGQGHDADALAFLRDEDQFFNLTLAEQPSRKASAHGPGEDFAGMVLRNFLLASWFKAGYAALANSADAQLAAIAAKSLKEVRYHQQHNAGWVVRLGDGTAESARRMQAAVERAWPYTAEMFDDDKVDAWAESSGHGPRRAALLAAWDAEVGAVFAEAGLERPAPTPFVSTGSQGRHSEHLGFVLAEMQMLPRRHPGARW